MSKAEIDHVIGEFRSEFGKEPEVCVLVPGRVNIIGEHVDYSGFPVLPMALERCIIVAAAKDHSCGDAASLTLVNVDNNHNKATRAIHKDIDIDYMRDGWSSYFLCGMKGALECASNTKTPSILGVVSGTVPPGAGLSSSSALVCAAFLTTAHINQTEISMVDAAVKCASCERYIGTEGGGMDQAIALLASPGCAKLVEFEPKLEAVNVCLPDEAVFVVAHSQATKNKAASSEFNTRVVECRLASQILAKSKGGDWKKLKKLKHVLMELRIPLESATNLVNQVLTKDVYTKQQICEILNVNETNLDNESLSHNTRDIKEFKLRQRALHVFSEAQRVYEWKNSAEQNDLTRMGQLMNESHESLRTLYECSHRDVDKLVKCCLDGGALGARITGAGWGGCVVALTTKSNVNTFISSVKKSFYQETDCDNLIFPTTPASGARVFKLPF